MGLHTALRKNMGDPPLVPAWERFVDYAMNALSHKTSILPARGRFSNVHMHLSSTRLKQTLSDPWFLHILDGMCKFQFLNIIDNVCNFTPLFKRFL